MRLARTIVVALFATFGLMLTVSLSAGKEESKDLNIGDPAPVFTSKDDQGNSWKSTDVIGKKVVVVYFYPADMTGGCTKQACGFRDDMKPLTDKGVEVIGVSGDSVEGHQLFKRVHKLNFTLLADEDGTVAKKFGLPVTKGGMVKAKDPDGKDVVLTRGVTAPRWTFVIDKSGKIAYKDTKVAAAQDSKKILAAVEKLK